MRTLFKETERIYSANFNQDRLLEDIVSLYCPDGIELDPTYNVGSFYKSVAPPRLKYDLTPSRVDVEKADCRNLPIVDASIKSIMFDPPFLAWSGKNMHREYTSLMGKKYLDYQTYEDLFLFYRDSLKEFYRILKPTGILIFKCMDNSCSSVNTFTHVLIMEWAEKIGFKAVDLFILLNRRKLISSNWKNQYMARKIHSYFWVFRKN